MDVSATFLGGVRFEVEARGHRLICDQPLDNGGGDEGMSPAGIPAGVARNVRGLLCGSISEDAGITCRGS